MPEPTRTQRLGAYAVVTDGERILLTRISAVGYPDRLVGAAGRGSGSRRVAECRRAA